MKKIIILIVSLACVYAAPRRPLNTYDQRQDGGTNVHVKFDNFMAIFAPSNNFNLRTAASPIAADISKALELQESIDSSTAHSAESLTSDENESGVNIVAIVKDDVPIHDTKSTPQSSGLVSRLEEEKKGLTENSKSEVHTKRARSLKNRSSEISSISKLPPKDNETAPLENKVAAIVGKNRGNYIGSVETESKLIGEGIENCGPDRFRNRAGVCQFRVEA